MASVNGMAVQGLGPPRTAEKQVLVGFEHVEAAPPQHKNANSPMKGTIAELNCDQIGGEWVKQLLQFCTCLKPCIQPR